MNSVRASLSSKKSQAIISVNTINFTDAFITHGHNYQLLASHVWWKLKRCCWKPSFRHKFTADTASETSKLSQQMWLRWSKTSLTVADRFCWPQTWMSTCCWIHMIKMIRPGCPLIVNVDFPSPKITQLHNLSAINWRQLRTVSDSESLVLQYGW